MGLISNGESKDESAFLDASAGGPQEGEGGEPGSTGGRDVFFLTTAKLAPQDVDDSYDIYDAHECTSESPCSKPATSPPPCENEASCKPAPEPEPGIYGAPASATFSGPGNLTPPAPAVVKPLTRAQELSKALSSCKSRYKKQPKKRAQCEAAARKKFGAKAPKKKTKKK